MLTSRRRLAPVLLLTLSVGAAWTTGEADDDGSERWPNRLVRTPNASSTTTEAEAEASPALRGFQLQRNGLEAYRVSTQSRRFHRAASHGELPSVMRRYLLARDGLRPVRPTWRRTRSSTPFDELTMPSNGVLPLFHPWIADVARWGTTQESLATAGNCACPVDSPGETFELALAKNPVTPEDLDLTWQPSCASPADDYSVHEGTIGNWYDHSAKVCTTGGAPNITLTPGRSSRYFLVVPLSPDAEGSYGADSGGGARPPGLASCRAVASFDQCP